MEGSVGMAVFVPSAGQSRPGPFIGQCRFQPLSVPLAAPTGTRRGDIAGAVCKEYYDVG